MGLIQILVDAGRDFATEFLGLEFAGVSAEGLIVLGVVGVAGLYIANKLGYSISKSK